MSLNMFAHADYSGTSSLEIDVFKDRVCFYNPGFFPRGLTPLDFAEEKEAPIVRNPKINEILFKTEMVESFGTGFERTFSSLRAAEISSHWETTMNGFRFTIGRPLGQKNVPSMSQTDHMVLDSISSGEFTSAKEFAEKIGKSLKTIQRSLKKLKDMGLIKHEGPNSGGKWTEF